MRARRSLHPGGGLPEHGREVGEELGEQRQAVRLELRLGGHEQGLEPGLELGQDGLGLSDLGLDIGEGLQGLRLRLPVDVLPDCLELFL